MINMESSFPVNKGNISDQIIEQITQQIINGELYPGDKLPTELEFCEQLGVSRNVVREAIKGLEALGVVEIRRGEGTFIVNEYTKKLINPIIYGLILTQKSVYDLLEMNICMLNEILKLGRSRATNEDIELISAEYDALRQKVYADVIDVDDMTVQSTVFYKTLARLTKNPPLIQVYDIILDMLNPLRRKGFEYVAQSGNRDGWIHNYQLIMQYLHKEDIRASEICNKILDMWDEALT